MKSIRAFGVYAWAQVWAASFFLSLLSWRHLFILAAMTQSPGWALGLELGVGDSYESLLGQAQSCRRAVRACMGPRCAA